MGASFTPRSALDEMRSALEHQGFCGDVEASLGARMVAATDNSIYEVVPDAVVYPRESADVNRIVRAASGLVGRALPLTARGGNTGTNGQSLNSGVVIDFARHMNNVLEVDVANGRVIVEPGVVLDQLNALLAGEGLFFPPMVSTASRATIGGMVATDASGKGSRVYGKTSDYIEAMDVVLSDGSDLRVAEVTMAEAKALAERDGIVGRIYREALRVFAENVVEIDRVFPDMNRGLTGYNLQKSFDTERQTVSLCYLLAGSEGTLALTKSVTLRVIPKPAHKALAVLRYDDFDRALRDVGALVTSDPVAVEILDDKVLGVATTDIIWSGIEAVLGGSSDKPVQALVFVEYAGSDEVELDRSLVRMNALRGKLDSALIDVTIVREANIIRRLWELREKSVGLLARLGAGKQGMPFVEDTAVPPEHLADYVSEFRTILDRRGLKYGMFGHADVGCLHVRPFLDMKDPNDAALIRPISDEVAALTKRYGGLLWGEHGRGFRGEYSPFFFGEALYAELVKIKFAFDPGDLFNPGKLASPRAAPLDKIDEVPFRGQLDRHITPELAAEFDRSIACNGNGACFTWDALDVMCPSYKGTRDRAQSPKGRATLLRAWAREDSAGNASSAPTELEEAVKSSLDTCLSCKGCTTLCPVKVDVPTLKSRFLSRYYERHARPRAHLILAQVETLFAQGRRLPKLTNAVLGSAVARRLTARYLGFVDLPAFSERVDGAPLPEFTQRAARGSTVDELRNTLVLVEDTFTASFDREVMVAATAVLRALGYRLYRLPARANGKVLHLLGLRDAFARVAAQRVRETAAVVDLGVRLVGLDAATSLMFEQEYREFVPNAHVVVHGLEAILAEDISAGRIPSLETDGGSERTFAILSHCTETALRSAASGQWVEVFARFGLKASSVRTGCCGMAGLFGHERRNLPLSRRLFDLSWAEPLRRHHQEALATGFSCRSQAKRFTGVRPRHPIEVLCTHLTSE